jgi:AcrR family transcriptional regulator
MSTRDASRAIRQDAARNREQLLIAARKVFAERGHDAPLEEVAKAAAVSRTTLYRHFATREQLAAIVLEDNVARIERCAFDLRNSPEGIVRLLDLVLDMQVEDRSFAAVLADADVDWFTALARRTEAAFRSLLKRGRDAGIVHPTVTGDDIMLAVSMFGTIAESDASDRKRAIKRGRVLLHRALFLGY